MRFERRYPYSREAVWKALTAKAAIEQWWVETDFEPVVGRRFYMQDKPQPGWEGRTEGVVLEADPVDRLVYTWKDPKEPDFRTMTLTWVLADDGAGGTHLVFEQTGFKGLHGLFMRAMMLMGWRGFFNKLLPSMAAHVAKTGLATNFSEPPKRIRVGWTPPVRPAATPAADAGHRSNSTP